MHILTKVFVLFASILSVLMAALAISYTVSADRIVADYEHAVQARIAAENARKSEATSHARERTTLQQTIDQLRQERSSLESQIRENESIIADKTVEARTAVAARDSLEAKIGQFGVTAETQTALIASYKSELAALHSEQLRWREDRIDLEGKLSDLNTQATVYEANQRAMQEQLRELRDQLGGGVTRTTGASGTTGSSVLSGPPVRGQIQSVRTEPGTGDTLVQISLGANDRIRENTRLFANRDGRRYLADVEIIEVDLNHSIGRVINLRPGEQIRPGDFAWSRLSN